MGVGGIKGTQTLPSTGGSDQTGVALRAPWCLPGGGKPRKKMDVIHLADYPAMSFILVR